MICCLMFAVCDFFPFVLSVCRGKNKPAEEKLATGKKKYDKRKLAGHVRKKGNIIMKLKI